MQLPTTTRAVSSVRPWCGDTVPFFNTAAVAALRQRNLDALDSVALIEAPARAASAGGGANTGALGWSPVALGDAVPCRLAPIAAPGVVIQAAQLTNPARVVVVFDLEGPAVLPGYRLTVTGVDGAGASWSRAVTVIGPKSPRTSSAMRAFVCADVGPTGA